MSLYHKYRPRSFKTIVGNSNVIRDLQALLAGNPPHAFLILGPTGCGKTTIGRIIAKELECKGHDFKEIDSADFRGIDMVREMRRQSKYAPLQSPCRVWIIDECHKLTNDAQNAILKLLEDPPNHVYFVLCTTEPHKLIKTVRGRCSTFQVNPLSEEEMQKLLNRISKKETGEVLDELVHEQIHLNSFGLPRNAIQILEKVLLVPPGEQKKAIQQAADEQSESIELCRALIKGARWKTIREILTGLKDQDPEGVRRHVLGYAASVLLRAEHDKAERILDEFYEPFYNIGFPGLVYSCYSVTKN